MYKLNRSDSPVGTQVGFRVAISRSSQGQRRSPSVPRASRGGAVARPAASTASSATAACADPPSIPRASEQGRRRSSCCFRRILVAVPMDFTYRTLPQNSSDVSKSIVGQKSRKEMARQTNKQRSNI
uniref:Uncharacterized protein n=1 Tax=Oryza glumipatula TaxID=40148 RepID=A0A0D9YVT9_9ORYZ